MSRYQRFLPYGVAIGSTAIALLLTVLVDPLLTHPNSTFFFAAVMITTWSGGFRPGLVAIVLSTLVISLFFVPSRGEFTGFSIGDLLQFATLSLVVLVLYQVISNVSKSQQQGEELHQCQQTELLLQQQLKQQQLVTEITHRIRQSLNLQEILQTTVEEVRQYLQVDRVIIFQFTPNWGGKVAVESVVDETLAIFPFNIYDPCIGDRYVEPFLQGLVMAKADIYTADISSCHVEFLAKFQVRANLVVPILKNNRLWGLLIAHHCIAPRQWQESEIGWLQQIAA
ncbi:MAG TPA: GAF domain-containing protein, partial [Allocoleopsis sp.]